MFGITFRKGNGLASHETESISAFGRCSPNPA
jgi:hypothetical protein